MVRNLGRRSPAVAAVLHHAHPIKTTANDIKLDVSDMRKFALFFVPPVLARHGETKGVGQMIFWGVAGILGLVVAGILGLALTKPGETARQTAEFDVQVYRDQLKDIARDLTRGVVTPDEADALRTEVSRRLLAADSQIQDASENSTQATASKATVLGVSAAVFAGTLGLYWTLGAPGYPDLPIQARLDAAEAARANRPSQVTAEAEAEQRAPIDVPASEEFLALMEQLRTTVAQRPSDQQGLVLLARNEAQLGNFPAAYKAQRQLIDVKGDAATVEDRAQLADLMIIAAGGYVSPEAETVLSQILDLDPQNGTARYYSGLMFSQTGRPDAAFNIWRELLENSPPDAGWVPPIRAQIEDMAIRSGVSYTLPDPLAGPDQDTLDAAQNMSAQERQEMIQGMVAGLSERLANEGGTAQEWARLINALGVLGRLSEADAIWDNAREVFADDNRSYRIVLEAAQEWDLAN